MKFTRSSLAAFSGAIALTLLIAGCSKNNNNSSAGLSATVGSSSFSAGTSPGQLQAIFNTTGPYYDIAGLVLTAHDTSALEITVPPTTKLGTPVSSDTSLLTINYSPHFPSIVYMAGFGYNGHAIATITSQDTVNHKVAGTFSGVVYNLAGADSLVITNGKFNTSYTVQ